MLEISLRNFMLDDCLTHDKKYHNFRDIECNDNLSSNQARKKYINKVLIDDFESFVQNVINQCDNGRLFNIESVYCKYTKSEKYIIVCVLFSEEEIRKYKYTNSDVDNEYINLQRLIRNKSWLKGIIGIDFRIVRNIESVM